MNTYAKTPIERARDKLEACPEMTLAKDYGDALRVYLTASAADPLYNQWDQIMNKLSSPRITAGYAQWQYGHRIGKAGIRDQLIALVELHDEMDASLGKDVRNRDPGMASYRRDALDNVAHYDLALLQAYAWNKPEVLRDTYLKSPTMAEQLRDACEAVLAQVVLLNDPASSRTVDDLAREGRVQRDAFDPACLKIVHHYQSTTQLETELIYADSRGETSIGRFGDSVTLNDVGEYEPTPAAEQVNHARRMFYCGHPYESSINPLVTRGEEAQAGYVARCVIAACEIAERHPDAASLREAIQSAMEVIGAVHPAPIPQHLQSNVVDGPSSPRM